MLNIFDAIDELIKNNTYICNQMDTVMANKKIKGRSVAAPSIPKAGFTKKRRRLEDGGKATE